MPSSRPITKRLRAWRPTRHHLRLTTFALAMFTIVYAGSVPRPR